MNSRDELIAQAKPAHDEVCNCDPRYLMSCSKMASAILDLARPSTADQAAPASLPASDAG